MKQEVVLGVIEACPVGDTFLYRRVLRVLRVRVWNVFLGLNTG